MLCEVLIFGFVPDILLFGQSPVSILYVLTGVSFLGALEAHGISRAIYGPGGPEERPKHGTVQIRHTLAIVLRENPEDIPVIPCRIAQSGIVSEFVSYVNYRLQKSVADSSSGADTRFKIHRHLNPLPSKHRFETAMDQFVELRELMSWRDIPMIVYFLPMWSLKYLMWVSFLALVAFIFQGTATYVAVLLLFAHVILMFRSIFWAPIPPVLNPDGLEDRFIPEYKIHEEDDKKP